MILEARLILLYDILRILNFFCWAKVYILIRQEFLGTQS
jgi:hypothetical protein